MPDTDDIMDEMIDSKLERIDQLREKIQEMPRLSSAEIAQLRQYYKVGLTYSSNALEGNSLTEIETKVVIEDGITIGGKSVREHFEAIGHSDAVEFLYEAVKSPLDVTEELIKTIHHLFYHRIEGQKAGNYRTVKVFVSGTDFDFPKPHDVPRMMREWTKNLAPRHPVIYAADAHIDLVTIHPFEDGNGRTARLIMNLILLHHRYPIAIIPPVRRVEYLEALRASNRGDRKPFYGIVCDAVIESQKDYIRMLG